MADSKIETLLDPNLFGAAKSTGQVVAESIVGSGVDSGAGSSEQMAQLAQQLQQLETVSQAETEKLAQNTQAVVQNTSQIGQSGGGSGVGKPASAAESFLGLGLSPLITGLIGLFGGGGDQQTGPVRFALPAAVNVNAGVREAAPTQVGAATNPAAQITVQVQAMDSRSFLDHSNEIAMAVRQAMLESGALNDVIREV